MYWIIELERGVYLADGDGDPPRTLVRKFCRRFDSLAAAREALAEARRYREFENALIRRMQK